MLGRPRTCTIYFFDETKRFFRSDFEKGLQATKNLYLDACRNDFFFFCIYVFTATIQGFFKLNVVYRLTRY